MGRFYLFFLIFISNITYAQTNLKVSVLQDLVDEFKLVSVGGISSVNSELYSYSIVNGKWVGAKSQLSDSISKEENFEVISEIETKLKNLKIVVNKNLSINFQFNDKIILKIPFKGNGMYYKRRVLNHTTTLGALFQDLNKLSTFIDGELFLYAKDMMNYDIYQPYDLIETGGDAYVLSYHIKNKEFRLFMGNIIDNSYYTFKKM